jgi:GntR family transcriptional regulator
MSSHPITDRLAARVARGSAEPVYQVIVEDVWLAVVDGSLATAARLPTARELAIALGVSPRTVERAYTELERRGVLATRPGEGTFVSLAPPSEAERARQREFAELCRETVDRADDLGFSVRDLIEALAEFRTPDRAPSTQDMEP